jgi:hypothetical protein
MSPSVLTPETTANIGLEPPRGAVQHADAVGAAGQCQIGRGRCGVILAGLEFSDGLVGVASQAVNIEHARATRIGRRVGHPRQNRQALARSAGVARYVGPEILAQVAREHAKGT